MADEVVVGGGMPNLTVRNIPGDTYRLLKQRAKARGHSLNAEILAILSDQDAREGRRLVMEEVLPRIDKVRAEIARRHPVKIRGLPTDPRRSERPMKLAADSPELVTANEDLFKALGPSALAGGFVARLGLMHQPGWFGSASNVRNC